MAVRPVDDGGDVAKQRTPRGIRQEEQRLVLERLEREPSLGARIAAARVARGLNRKQFAAELGTSWDRVQKWEESKEAPSVEYLFAIFKVTNLTSVLVQPEVPMTKEQLQGLLELLREQALTEAERIALTTVVLDGRLRPSKETYRAILTALRVHRPPPDTER